MTANFTVLFDLFRIQVSVVWEFYLVISTVLVLGAPEREEGPGCKFTVDKWRRHNPSEGNGVTCVMQDGKTFEKTEVNITEMSAHVSQELQASIRARFYWEFLGVH
ncbi:Oxygen-dependent coproporphyrinogen-III oxidase [Portunus trituberculatus]|uniref:Oxygen-dependent coproporphyrinogen-III oxidase n=1 Tax=Portunus trituberculatus TaxID=210409 RepID=A0A5B7FWU4_PORTR|nr:Oxygen-dependent coproporphyrinogen-III oxidase [Portunus trituberculatus]